MNCIEHNLQSLFMFSNIKNIDLLSIYVMALSTYRDIIFHIKVIKCERHTLQEWRKTHREMHEEFFQYKFFITTSQTIHIKAIKTILCQHHMHKIILPTFIYFFFSTPLFILQPHHRTTHTQHYI